MRQEYSIKLTMHEDGSCEWTLWAESLDGRKMRDTAFTNGTAPSIPMALAYVQDAIADIRTST